MSDLATTGSLIVTDPAGSPTIHTPDARLRAFISSTLGELAAEREAAKTAVRTLRLAPVMFEFGARPHPPQELYRSYLAQSDVFIGVYWQSYGWVAPGDEISGIEDEYLRSGDMPKLIYVKEPADDREPRLTELLSRIRGGGRVAYKKFGTPGELAELIVDDLALLVTERFHAVATPRAPLPTGTLTFLYADVEDSTGLAERDGPAYVAAFAGYLDRLAVVAERHGGRVVDTEGDGSLCVFPESAPAAAAAIDLQRELADAELGLRVRIGAHSGTATVTPTGYVGRDVHRTVRIATAAHGGQVVVSATVRTLIEDAAAAQGWSLTPLGAFALRGLSRTERLWQLDAGSVPGAFPALRSRRAARVELPAPLTSLVDRTVEVAEVAALLARPDVHLLTLSGPGGIGKTRVALAVAEAVADGYPDGVFFVDVSSTTDPDRVLPAVAETVGVSLEGDALESLSDALGSQQLLVILDNVEQVAAVGAQIARLLRRCPGLNLLVTSRVILRVSGEREYPVAPLPIPPADAGDDATAIGATAAVRLFVDRAVQVRPSFTLTEENAAAVAAICRALDGVPLALELAAARLRMLTPQALYDRLTSSLTMLTGGPGDRPERHRGVRATIDWSHDLLGAPEQRVFRRLGVFADGFGLDAAEAVCIDEDVDVVTALELLVEHSLVASAADSDAEPRLRLLTTVREYATERLEAAGEYELARDRHAEWFGRLTAARAAALKGAAQRRTVQQLAREWSNLEAAADWLLERGDCDALVQLLHDLWPMLWVEVRLTEVRRWLDAIPAPCEHMSALAQARFLWLLGGTSYERGDYAEAREHLLAAIPTLQREHDDATLAWARFVLGLCQPALDADGAATAAAVEAARLAFQAADDRWGEGWAQLTAGILAATAGDLDRARSLHDACATIAELLDSPVLRSQAQLHLGLVAAGAGDLPLARRHLASAVEVLEAHPLREGQAYCLEALAVLDFQQGQTEAAMIALGAASALRDKLSLHPWPAVSAFLGVLYAAADAVTEPALQRARADGRQMDPIRAARLALGDGAVSLPAA